MTTEEETPISFRKRIKRISILLLGLVFTALLGYGLVLFGGLLVVDKEKLILDETTTIETVEGEVMALLYNENRSLVSLDQVPKHVQDSFIAIEDVRFYEHRGLDYRSIVRAVYKDIVAQKKVEGASTITQQLAKNLFLRSEERRVGKERELWVYGYNEKEKEAVE